MKRSFNAFLDQDVLLLITEHDRLGCKTASELINRAVRYYAFMAPGPLPSMEELCSFSRRIANLENRLNVQEMTLEKRPESPSEEGLTEVNDCVDLKAGEKE